jgi:hypothetical protein
MKQKRFKVAHYQNGSSFIGNALRYTLAGIPRGRGVHEAIRANESAIKENG